MNNKCIKQMIANHLADQLDTAVRVISLKERKIDNVEFLDIVYVSLRTDKGYAVLTEDGLIEVIEEV